MKKSLLAIVFAAAAVPLTFAAQTPAPAQSQPNQSTSTTKPAKKAKKHTTKKTTGATSTPTAAPQK